MIHILAYLIKDKIIIFRNQLMKIYYFINIINFEIKIIITMDEIVNLKI